MKRQHVLLNPGPVNTSLRVQKALFKGDLCHREPEFSNILRQIRKKLLKIFHIEKIFTSILITGSGTAALEAALVSCLDKNKKTLVIDNGVYGARMAEILKRYRYPRKVMKLGWAQYPDLKKIEAHLNSDANIKAIAMVHHETSTGMLNPIKEIGRLARRTHKTFIVDAISSLGGEPVDFKNIDVCVGTANKCIQGFPGVAFVLVRKKIIKKMKDYSKPTLYFDLLHLYESQEKGTIPFTPAIPAYDAFLAALDELMSEGLHKRFKRYRDYARLIREGLKKAGLNPLIKNSKERSQILIAYDLPKGWGYARLHDLLKKKGFVIYAGQGQLQKKIFRIANMGWLKKKDLQKLVHFFKANII